MFGGSLRLLSYYFPVSPRTGAESCEDWECCHDRKLEACVACGSLEPRAYHFVAWRDTQMFELRTWARRDDASQQVSGAENESMLEETCDSKTTMHYPGILSASFLHTFGIPSSFASLEVFSLLQKRPRSKRAASWHLKTAEWATRKCMCQIHLQPSSWLRDPTWLCSFALQVDDGSGILHAFQKHGHGRLSSLKRMHFLRDANNI